MTLVRSSPGEARIVDFEPSIELARDALYVPAAGPWAEQGWGLYDHAGRLLVAAGSWITDAQGASAPRSGCWTTPADASAEATLPPTDYVYGGLLERDTAGFLLDTLPRFWSSLTPPRAGRTVVFHAREPLSSLFKVPVIASTMAALGITPAHCVSFERPIRLASVAVPTASFERGRFAFGAFARLAATLGIRLSGSAARHDAGRAPLHVSSARERLAVLADEDTFDRALEAQGVEVVHPTEMSFASLVSRVRAAPLVSSITRGEVIDTASLACLFREPARRMVLVMDGEPARDATIIDRLCRHETLLLRGSGDDPAALARSWLRSMRRLGGSRELELAIGGDDPGLELGAEAVSCVDSDGQDASVLLGGLLTGLAQWRVGGRQYPWVEVELGRVAAVRQVRVHGPAAGDDRPSAMNLFGSFDGVDWNLLASRGDDGPVGGPGGAHDFAAAGEPWQVRRLRLQSGAGALSLDQIEIFGAADGG